MTVYIACGLTHVPRDEFQTYTRFVQELASSLEQRNVVVHYALRDSDPQLAEKPFEERARYCYRWDREMVERADLVIADATYPSTGLGIELEIAAAHEIPIIICFERTRKHQALTIEYENPDHTHHYLQIGEGFVSLMALGIPSVCRVIPYGSFQEGIAAVVRAVNDDSA